VLVALGVWAAVSLAEGDPVGDPRVGEHWHARYEVWICGEPQPNFPTWRSGVSTEADGIIHIHPFQAFEEGDGSRLVKFFEYGEGELTQTEMQCRDRPAGPNGDECPDGSPGARGLGERRGLGDWSEYTRRTVTAS
jgi:hypothetical protein